MEELLRRGSQRRNQKASQEAIAETAERLQACGFTRANPEVFRTVCEYGAAEKEKLNGKGLFIRGPVGIGKSYGVACLAAFNGWPVLAATELQAAFLTAKSDDEFWKVVDALDFYERPRTIVIDDLGTEDCPIVKYGTATNLMADVLDRRYYRGFMRHGVRTIVTCNLTDKQLKDRYGVRIDDRMNEMFEFATVDGRSLRN
jgi:DNA replication protein DnaC